MAGQHPVAITQPTCRGALHGGVQGWMGGRGTVRAAGSNDDTHTHGRGRTMSGWLIALTGVIYTYVAVDMGREGNWGMAIAYTGYAFANIGLYLLAER